MSRGRKRTKYTITVEQMKAYNEISKNLTIDRIVNYTTIFKDPTLNPPLDPYTRDEIQKTFTLWFNSWIAPHLNKM